MAKIGIDIINLRILDGGLGRYALQLINGLAAVDKENEYIIFVNNEIANRIIIDNPKFHLRVINTPRRRYAPWNQVYFALNRNELFNIDLLHSPVTPSPLLLFGAVKTIVTLHDLAWKIFPETFRLIGVAWWSFAWPKSLKQSGHIVTDSESAKDDVIKFYHTEAEKISVIYPFVSIDVSQISAQSLTDTKKRYGLPEKYILSVGVSHKRKNLGSLIKAFEALKKEKQISHKLVLVGPKGESNKALTDQINQLGLQEEVIFTGSVADADLPSIYKGADVFVFPSLYEGFGYPPLEAMACGTPVIVSNNSSLPEVVEKAGLYINPDDFSDIAEKIFQIISSRDLADKFKKLGQEQSRKFTMEKMIKEYIQVYKKIL